MNDHVTKHVSTSLNLPRIFALQCRLWKCLLIIQMSFSTLYKTLQRELCLIQKKAFEVHAAKEIEHAKAKLQYQKIQLIKQRLPTTEIDQQISNLKQKGLEAPKFDSTLLNQLVKEQTNSHDVDLPALSAHLAKVKLQQLQNFSTFLRSQREYTELLERYNPGLTMNQEDKVRRTANRVGLSVPE